MLKSKHIDTLVITLVLLLMLLVGSLYFAEELGIKSSVRSPGYEHRLFDKTKVHLVEIDTEEWDELLENALDEAYIPATVTIDGERFTNVGLRTKGNNSLRLTHRYGHDRYSLKLEFDHYQVGSYHGLDKFSLDSSFQDNSYLKSYLAFDMFEFLDVATPLSSFTWVKVNGDDWGLFLAIEEPEESFAKRLYGPQHGELYKPGYKSLEDENADVHLRYTDDQPESYDNIFRKAKFKPTLEDQKRLIESLRVLSTGEHLEQVVDLEQVINYFVVQGFVVNLDSYLGKNGHNYFLYEEEGVISMIPWDYNLAFGTYALGMPEPSRDITRFINYPITTPGEGEYMLKRPLFHELMKHQEHYLQYRETYDHFIREYVESGHFEREFERVSSMIAPYVKKDPTAFISYEDHLLGVETIRQFILLRAESVRGQLEGTIGDTMRTQRHRENFIDASSIRLEDLGEIDDLKD